MWPEWTARDVQTELKKTLKLDQSSADSSLVLKVRNGEGMLLPMTPTALNSTSKQPLVIEVCAPHQHGKLPISIPSAYGLQLLWSLLVLFVKLSQI